MLLCRARLFTHCASPARFSSTASPRNRLPDAASLVSCANPESIGGNAASPFLRDHSVRHAHVKSLAAETEAKFQIVAPGNV